MQPNHSSGVAVSGQPGPRSPSFPAPGLMPALEGRPWRYFALSAVGLMLAFGFPLWNLILFAAGSALYSYILLIPFISSYLVWINRRNLPPHSPPPRRAAAGFVAAGSLILIVYWLVLCPRVKLAEEDYLAAMTISFLLLLGGAGCLFLGRKLLKAIAFPLVFLMFMIPLPAFAVNAIDTFLQHGSAAVAGFFFKLSGTPVLDDGLVFQLPGISIRVAPECSGIHSSLVLFITSVLAGQVFLRTPWKRTVFVLVVIPLAMLRNGFRIFTVGELCVHIGPQMINSFIHRSGGPLFFVLSLIPLLLVLLLLKKSERTGSKRQSSTTRHDHA